MADTARQSVAQSLSEFLHRRNGWVTSPLPLRGDRPLRFDCRALDASALTGKLGQMGFTVRFCGTTDQPRPSGFTSVTTFEIDLPHEGHGHERQRQKHDSELATAEDLERNRKTLIAKDPFAAMENSR